MLVRQTLPHPAHSAQSALGAANHKHNHSNQHTIYKQLEGTMRFRNFRTGSAPLSARSKHFFNPPAKINLNFFRKPLSHRHHRRLCRYRRRCPHRHAAAAIQPNKPQTISLSPVRPFTAHSHSRTVCGLVWYKQHDAKNCMMQRLARSWCSVL